MQGLFGLGPNNNAPALGTRLPLVVLHVELVVVRAFDLDLRHGAHLRSRLVLKLVVLLFLDPGAILLQ